MQKSGILDRLRLWSEIQRVQPTKESAAVAGGREGELLLGQLVGASFKFKAARLLASRRIPSKRQGRRREIDLIVCTPRMIHLIEVKNWSGQLSVRNGDWRQTRRGGDVVDHGDLIGENQLRRDAVVEYLHDRGLILDEQFVREHIVPRVVFTNPRLELDPAIEARPDVISRRELDGYLGRQRKTADSVRMFSSLIEFCLDSEARLGEKLSRALVGQGPSGHYERIVTLLSETDTWDQVHYFGTQVITGDVVGLRIGSKTYRRADLVESVGKSPIRLGWTRGRFWGFVKAVTGLGSLGSLRLGNALLQLAADDTLTFHAVGDRQPSTFRLVEIDQVVLG
jgi:hypothetical protein